ncbi:MAG: helix-turn-helix domain-containing protein [Candidatus Nanopelagicales bacterium]|nr:helix-turn-helix domain-containing protein [Candidatus Nanopelagicales bacterium]
MEQRYQAVSLVIHDGESVVEVARRFGVSRQTVHSWLSRAQTQSRPGQTHTHRIRKNPRTGRNRGLRKENHPVNQTHDRPRCFSMNYTPTIHS